MFSCKWDYKGECIIRGSVGVLKSIGFLAPHFQIYSVLTFNPFSPITTLWSPLDYCMHIAFLVVENWEFYQAYSSLYGWKRIEWSLLNFKHMSVRKWFTNSLKWGSTSCACLFCLSVVKNCRYMSLVGINNFLICTLCLCVI